MVIYTDFALFVLHLLFLFIGANLVAWSALRLFPDFFVLTKGKQDFDPDDMESFYSTDERFRMLGLQTDKEFRRYWKETPLNAVEIAYDSLVEFRHKEFNGEFWNISPHGFRHVAQQGPWPPSAENLNVFVFGGSTTYHIGPDWTSIASCLQEKLDSDTRPVRVYNFGRCAYFSTQETLLLMRLVSQGFVPDMVIFFDGLNDAVRNDDETATAQMFKELLRANASHHQEHATHSIQGKVRWIRLRLFLQSLPLLRVGESIVDKLAGDGPAPNAQNRPYSKPSPEDLEYMVNRLTRNYRQVLAVCDSFGIAPLFVVQPVPVYKYDLKNHDAIIRGMGQNEAARDLYPPLLHALGQPEFQDKVLDLSGIQEGVKESLYIDEVHYSASFANVIAGKISEECLKVIKMM